MDRTPAVRQSNQGQVALVAEKEAAMKAGTLAPFQGPLKAQDGKEVVAAGKTMPDKDIANMSFYVQGVEGALPKK
jgi:simple sugar transport system substrate-binding protein